MILTPTCNSPIGQIEFVRIDNTNAKLSYYHNGEEQVVNTYKLNGMIDELDVIEGFCDKLNQICDRSINVQRR